MHLNPDFNLSQEEKEEYSRTIKAARNRENGVYKTAEVCNTSEGDLNQAFDPTAPGESTRVQNIEIFVDPNNGDEYRIFRMSEYLDVDDLLSRWVDATGPIRDQSVIAKYIDSMFGILMDVYCTASSSGSIRVSRACAEFINCILVNKFINFDLTETEKTHVVKDGSKVAHFNEWVENNKELTASFKIIENLSDNSVGWNELNAAILNKLLEGCTIPYASAIIDDNQFRKLKQLVLQLSSYRITIIEDGESGRESIGLAGMVEDTMLDMMETQEILYFDPIGDCPVSPRLGGYTATMSEYGHIIVPSTDMRRKDGKTYYFLTTADSSLYNEPDDAAKVKLVRKPLAVEAEDKAAVVYTDESGKEIIRTSENGGEMVNIPRFAIWTGHEQSFDKYAISNKSYFTYVTASKKYKPLNKDEMERVPTAGLTDLPDNALIEEVDGVEMCYLLGDGIFETIEVGSLLTPGKFYEIISLYDILDVAVGTPLLIMRNEKYDWFYCTGTRTVGTVDYPSGDTGTEYCNGNNLEVQTSDDKFDLENDFSNSNYAKAFGTPVFRIAVPTTGVEWSTPRKSVELEKYLQPTVTKEFVQLESREHVMLIEQIEDIDKELQEEEES
jgi:cytochrome oxidase Cu insertion factor (SCO1/SenC/PrrC family)